MKEKSFFLTILIFGFSLFSLAQKELTINVIPVDAEIYEITNNGGIIKKGVGMITIGLDKDKAVTYEVRKAGFVSVKKTFLREKKGQPAITIELTDRAILINASPSDATIYLNGADIGKSPKNITVPKGVSATIDIKKQGFVPISKTVYNKQGEEIPEQSYLFKLEDRIISIKVDPIDASISVDGKKKADGSTQVIIPKDKCVIIKVEKASYVSSEVTYCNKESETIPPFVEEIKLKDRSIQINAQPEDSRIFVDGKEVGRGSYAMKLVNGKCSEILVLKSGYVGARLNLCNQSDIAVEGTYAIKLKEDEAYLQSEESSIANKNFNLIIENTDITPIDAWKKLVSIIQSYFDEIETIDASTSYLKTNWVGKIFNVGSDFKSMIRTRVIITYGGENNKYNIKIQSEISKPESNCVRAANDYNGSSRGASSLTATNDECFEPVDRILRKYSGLISEIQRRFR